MNDSDSFPIIRGGQGHDDEQLECSAIVTAIVLGAAVLVVASIYLIDWLFLRVPA